MTTDPYHHFTSGVYVSLVQSLQEEEEEKKEEKEEEEKEEVEEKEEEEEGEEERLYIMLHHSGVVGHGHTVCSVYQFIRAQLKYHFTMMETDQSKNTILS